jgi:hypothetical protein
MFHQLTIFPVLEKPTEHQPSVFDEQVISNATASPSLVGANLTRFPSPELKHPTVTPQASSPGNAVVDVEDDSVFVDGEKRTSILLEEIAGVRVWAAFKPAFV